MSPFPELLASASHVDVAWFVAELAVKGSLVLLTAGAVSWLLRRASAATRHLIWSSALVMVLALPFGSAVLPAWHVPLFTAVPPPVASAREMGTSTISGPAPEMMDVPISAEDRLSPHEQAAAPAADQAAIPGPVPLAIDWIAVALYAWIAGAVITMLRLTLGVIGLWIVESRTRHVLSREWIDLTGTLSRQLGLARPVRLLQSRRATMPLSWGWMKPVVLLPADAPSWSLERRRIVLLHELAHVKRRDCLTQMLAQLACATYWFNPLVWFAASRLRAERERACDDLVLSAGTRSADYADHLLEIARAFKSSGFASWATVAMAKPSQLEGRLLAILDPTRRRTWPRWACAAAVAVIAIVALPIAAARPTVRVQAAALTAEPLPQRDPWLAPHVTDPHEQAPATANDAPRPSDSDAPKGGVRGGIAGGVREGVTNGIKGGIEGGVPGVIAGAVVTAIEMNPVIWDPVIWDPDHDSDKNKNKDKDKAAQDVVADRRVIDALVTALKDENKEVRQQAAEALGHIRDPRAIDGLTVALRDASPAVREQAASSLSHFKSQAAAGALLLALKDQTTAVRRQAAGGIARMRDVRHTDALAMLLQDTDHEVRQQAAMGLGQLRAASAVEPLSAALKDTNADVRQQAAFALGQIRDPKSVEALTAAVTDSNADVRQQAVFALGQIRSAAAVPALMTALSDKVADVREQAAFALGQIRDPKAVDALTNALRDPDADVREQAAFALGQLVRVLNKNK